MLRRLAFSPLTRRTSSSWAELAFCVECSLTNNSSYHTISKSNRSCLLVSHIRAKFCVTDHVTWASHIKVPTTLVHLYRWAIGNKEIVLFHSSFLADRSYLPYSVHSEIYKIFEAARFNVTSFTAIMAYSLLISSASCGSDMLLKVHEHVLCTSFSLCSSTFTKFHWLYENSPWKPSPLLLPLLL